MVLCQDDGVRRLMMFPEDIKRMACDAEQVFSFTGCIFLVIFVLGGHGSSLSLVVKTMVTYVM